MYVKFDNHIGFSEDGQAYNSGNYPHDGIFLVFSPEGVGVARIENGRLNSFVVLDNCIKVIKDDNLVPQKELDEANRVIDQLNMQLNSINRFPQTGVTEETLLKIIEIIMSHQPTVTPIITNPSMPVPPYEVWCDGKASGTTSNNLKID